MSSPSPYRPARGDRVAILVFMLAGVLIVAGAAISTYFRVMRILLGEAIPITVRPVDLELDAPIGPGRSEVPLRIDTATVTVPGLPDSVFAVAILEQLVRFGTVAAVVVCLALLARNVLRGRIFGRGNTALAATAGITALVGSGTALALGGAVGGSVLFDLAPEDAEGFVFLVAEPAPFIIGAFAFAVVLTAFTVGARLQRDTEGLV